MLPAPGWRRDLLVALFLAVVAALFRFPGLGFPPEEYFDEVYHAKTAQQLLLGETPVEWVHPPTAKLLIAIGVYFFGYRPWAWRLAPAIAGVLLAPVFYFLARRVLATERAVLLSCALLLYDGVYLVQSRIAMTNIFAVLFQLSAALVILDSALRERLPVPGMAGAGIALGLALSTRWTSLWATAFLGLTLLAVRRGRLFRPRELALVLLAFLVLPGALYFASYLPLIHQGHLHAPNAAPNHLRSLADAKRAVNDLAEEQEQVWRYHATLNAYHPYFSRWWTWPWLYRPTWYYYKQTGEAVRGIVAIGNPALWWVSVPVTLWALLTGLRARDPRRLFAGAGFSLLYLPWGLSPRTLNYSHYLFEAMPYACLSLGMLLDRAWEGRGALAARGYVLLVALLFVFFLPFLTGIPVPSAWFFARLGGVGPWTWFSKWI